MVLYNGIDELFIVQNLYLQQNAIQINRIQTKRDAMVDPFKISDRLFLNKFRLTKNVARF